MFKWMGMLNVVQVCSVSYCLLQTQDRDVAWLVEHWVYALLMQVQTDQGIFSSTDMLQCRLSYSVHAAPSRSHVNVCVMGKKSRVLAAIPLFSHTSTH